MLKSFHSKCAAPLFYAFVVMSQASCSGGGKKDAKEPVSGDGPSDKPSESSSQNGDLAISSDRRLLVNSMANNGFTSKTVNRAKANDLSATYSSAKSKEPQVAYGAVVTNRLAGKSAADSFDDARRVMDHLLSKNPDAELPEAIQLELALSALHTNKLALAEFYLDKLTRSKNARVKASAINALGVVAIRMERIPEAVAIFKEALAAVNDYEPALLNIGFLALQGGDASTAKKALGGLQDDWFVESGFISIERLEGDVSKAEQKCEKVLSKRPKHKPSLINCGINAYQGLKDFKRAREYFNRAMAVTGGSSAWDEKTGRLLGVVDAEESRANQAKQMREAEDRAAKANADKAKIDSGAAKPAEGGGATGPAKAQ